MVLSCPEKAVVPFFWKNGDNRRLMRRILHIDMDAFYASVEQRDQPELRGQAGRRRRRPRQRAASSRRRATRRARSACARRSRWRAPCGSARTLVIVRPDFAKYRAVSQQVFAIFRAVTPLVEPLSLDEAYLDVTENAWGEPLGDGGRAAAEGGDPGGDGLTASAGVAPNKFLAKIASAWKKPDGLTVIAPERVEPFLQQLPVDALWGVGPGDRAAAARARHRAARRRAHGRSGGAARGRRQPGGVAAAARRRRSTTARSSRTASRSRRAARTPTRDDLTDIDRDPRRRSTRWRATTRRGSAQSELLARTVTIKVRYADFTTITRSHTSGRRRATPTTSRSAPSMGPRPSRRKVSSYIPYRSGAAAWHYFQR